eukprot:4093633-Amphidinium_carterae.2
MSGVGALACFQEWQRAASLLISMPTLNVPASEVSLGTAVAACRRATQWEAAVALLKKPGLAGTSSRRSILTYTSAISACCFGQAWSAALALFEEAVGDGLVFDTVAVNTVVSGLRHSNAWSQANQVLRQCNREGAPKAMRVRYHERSAVNVQTCHYSAGHTPAMPDVLPGMLVEAGGSSGTYVDCTLGKGGHTRGLLRLLSPDGQIYALDIDPSAISEAERTFLGEPRLQIHHHPFGDLASVLPVQVDGIMADLGVSSMHLDKSQRGFSSLADEPLDLRMNPTCGSPVSEWLLRATSAEIAWVLKEHGEKTDPLLSLRLAEAIARRAAEKPPLLRTGQLTKVA